MRSKSNAAAAAAWIVLTALSLCWRLSGAGIVSGTTSGGSGSASGANSGGNNEGRFLIWEDFESPMRYSFSQLYSRKLAAIPDGQPNTYFQWFYDFSNPAGGTNSLAMEGGSYGMNPNLGSPPAPPGAGYGAHVYCSNSTSTGFSRIGGVFSFTNSGIANGFVLAPALIIGPNTVYSAGQFSGGDFLHIHMAGGGSIAIDRGITENLLNFNFPFSLKEGVQYPLDVQVVSNTCFVQIGGFFNSFTYSNLSTFCGPDNGKLATFELLGTTQNQYHFRWHSFYAGIAEPWAIAMAGLGNGMGANFSTSPRVNYRPTLTTNTWISGTDDGIVGMGSPSSSTTLTTNKLPAVTAVPGKVITVYDTTTTAGGSNIWIMPIDGTKINNGPILTNITVNNGSITFYATPQGWQILSKFP